MPGNEFEKQVHQKMEGLLINPSGQVWQKVQKAIKPKERDRRMFFVIPLLLLLLLPALYFLNRHFNTTDRLPTAQEKSPSSSPTEKALPVSDSIALSQPSINPLPDELPTGNHSPGAIETNAAQRKQVVSRNNLELKLADSHHVAEPTITRAVVQGRRTTGMTKGKLSIKIGMTAAEDTVSTLAKQDTGNIAGAAALTSSTAAWQAAPLVPDSISRISVTNNKQSMIKELPALDLNSDTSRLPTKSIRSKNWKISTNFSAGVSATSMAYLGIDLNSRETSYSPIPSNGSGQLPTTFDPSSLNPGFGFLVGLSAEKMISKRSGITLGLSYKRLTTTMKTGNRIDSSVSADLAGRNYMPGKSHTYHNHFDFVSVPIEFNWKATNQDQVPIFLNTGLNFSYLLGTNALQYDNSYRIHYKENSLFNRFQLGLDASLLFSFSRKDNAFMLGPHLSYTLTSMAGEGIYNDRRYSFIGLRVKKNLSNK